MTGMANNKVFYSWQSDLPNNTNRSFIETALITAIKETAAESSVEPVLDRDTRGIAGSPNIAQAIFDKIREADLFVADLSIIGGIVDQTGSPLRKSPNPNVLVETGFALRALGSERVLLVFNLAFGAIEELPFDLRQLRCIPYNCKVEDSEKGSIRRALTSQLKGALGAALTSPALHKKPDVRVTIAAGSVVGTDFEHKALLVTIQNHASVPVYLEQCGSFIPANKASQATMVFRDFRGVPYQPEKLEPGDSKTHAVLATDILPPHQQSPFSHFEWRDKLGRVYECEPAPLAAAIENLLNPAR